MNQPVPRHTAPERWRGWPRELWDPFGDFNQLWNRMGQLFESGGRSAPDAWIPAVETEETSGQTLRHRRGKFAYRTTLPADADAEKIDAQLADGILTVRLPKATKAQSRKIDIKD